MKVFVTGADGFIGSHLCEALRDRGDEVTGLALYNSFDSFGWLDEVEGVEKVRGDVRDLVHMRALIKDHEIVFHLAALVSVPYSFEAPQSFRQTNVRGTQNVLLAARDAGAKVVHTSTSEVYGSAQRTPMDESHPIHPQSPYAQTKVDADREVNWFHKEHGLPCVILRPFNTYGPRQSERAVIAKLVRQAIDPACEVIKIGNQKPVRDFMYVTDTVRAFLAISELHACETLNAGTGSTITIGDLAEVVAGEAGTQKPIVTDLDLFRPEGSEVEHLEADWSGMRLATNWAPAIGLDEGVGRTIDWWSSRDLRRGHRYLT